MLNDKRHVYNVILIVAVIFESFSYAQDSSVIARVNGKDILSSQVIIKNDKMSSLFEKRIGRKPNIEELKELQEVSRDYEQWIFCTFVKKYVIEKNVQKNLKNKKSSIDFEKEIFEDAAKNDPSLLPYLKSRTSKKDNNIERKIFKSWESAQIRSANIEIFNPQFKSYTTWLEHYDEMKSGAEIIDAFFNKKQSKGNK
ncbi:MAG: hypothetical protein WC708_15055 [Lentisphaeria bacterium]